MTDISEGIVGRAYGQGAYLVLAMDDLGRHLEPDLLCSVSRGAAVLVCHVHEGCMHSYAAYWCDDVEIWRVEHDSDQRIRHLDVRGDPPPELTRIRAAREAAQNAEPPKRPHARREATPLDVLSGFPPDLLQVGAQFPAPDGITSMPSISVDHIFDVPVELCHGLSFEVLVPAM